MTCVDGALLVEVADRVAILTVNRPHANNSLDGDLMRQLLSVAEELEHDDNVRVIVTTANVTSGATAWCPGLDFARLERQLGQAGADDIYYDGVMGGDYMATGVSRQGRPFDSLGAGRWVLRMHERLQKPTIAAINGAVAGGGLGWAAMHAYRIAGESAVFKAAFATLGVGIDMGASYFVTHLVGQAAAAEIFLRDQRVNAQTALAYGLVNQVVPDVEVLTRALDLARQMAELPPLGLRAALRSLRGAAVNTLPEQLALEWENQRITLASQDAAAAFRALKSRTKTTFVGR
jgi:2-(1,2-epoxy-1,2-dihydrophenyl)acetyl-CoA isomerase